MLTVTRNEHLVLTWLIFTASRGSVASLLARVSACLLGLPARLLTWFACVFALAQTMTWLAAEVRTTLELLAADFTAANIRKPARLILKSLLPTHARLLDQEGTFRA